MAPPHLVTIGISHFCEKARWALDRAGIEHTEDQHLPIFHWLPMKRAGGKGTLPVLRTDDGVYADSTDILRWVDEHGPPERRLYPEAADARANVEALEDHLDEHLGPATRRFGYDCVESRDLAVRYSPGVPAFERFVLSTTFPVVRRMVRFRYGIHDARVAADVELIDRELDELATLLDRQPFLSGERFGAADIAFASLVAPVLAPEQGGVALPRVDELPERHRPHAERWREHPAGRFALQLFAEHRGSSARIDPR